MTARLPMKDIRGVVQAMLMTDSYQEVHELIHHSMVLYAKRKVMPTEINAALPVDGLN